MDEVDRMVIGVRADTSGAVARLAQYLPLASRAVTT